MNSPSLNRRQFLHASTLLAATASLRSLAASAPPVTPVTPDLIIDLHQHLPFQGRDAEKLLAHQTAMGIRYTILLPAGERFELGAGVAPFPATQQFAEKHPDRFGWFANEITDHPEAPDRLRRQLRAGAIGVGEQKFDVACDSPEMERVIRVAEEFDVPILLHFEQGKYNHHLERLHRVLEKFPRVNFIGHAQTWWGHISTNYDEKVKTPSGPVVPGGLTDRLLSNYPNIYGDLSAGSGHLAFKRDPEHARAFIARHQDRLIFASDCFDSIGVAPACRGALQIAAVRTLAPNEAAVRKILYGNARKLLRLKLPSA